MPKKMEKKKPKMPVPVVKPEEKPKADMPSTLPMPAPVKPVSIIETIRGFKDIIPPENRYAQWVEEKARIISNAYGFQWIETPILEHASLFVRAVGKQTDIVEKEMFRFVDQGGDDMVLRPEGTASVVRAYINHGMLNQPQPVKLWYQGPMFRHDRPQAGRYRQFHQWSCETLGDAKPIVDAELIMVAWSLLKELGISALVQVNSIGDAASREVYKEKLVNWYRGHRASICEDCKRRLGKNPLRLLDCKQEGCRAIRANAPQLVDALDEDSKNHFMKVLEYLDEAEVPYTLEPYLVRGLDYYNRTVFELVPATDDDRAQNALGGGGRYDGLAEVLGGRATPAAGFSIGVERVILALKAQNIEPQLAFRPQVFVAQLGEQAKRKAMKLFEECRVGGVHVAATFTKDSLKGQLEAANRFNVRYTVIIGQKEILDGTVIIRDMESGVQEVHDQKKLITELKRKLAKAEPLPIGGAAPITSDLYKEDEDLASADIAEDGAPEPVAPDEVEKGGEHNSEEVI